ncbi:MAG: tyrosine-type recombinase/integrase [Alteromonadaceae bacterium]|nr:tyrosine-type recombinase/integrase [Alteromonadaceae bacterium]
MMTIKHVQWRNGVAFYRRRIPNDIKHHFREGAKRKSHVMFSLKTKDFNEAAIRAQRETERLDQEWGLLATDTEKYIAEWVEADKLLKRLGIRHGEGLRYDKDEIALERLAGEFDQYFFDENQRHLGDSSAFLPPFGKIAFDLAYNKPEDRPANPFAQLVSDDAPLFSKCVEEHIKHNPKRGSDDQFHMAVNLFMTLRGNLPVDQYKRIDAHEFVTHLTSNGKAKSTVKRYCAQVRPVFNTAILELEIPTKNPFARIRIPEGDTPTKRRLPFPLPVLHSIQSFCASQTDDKALLLGLFSDTGMRLNEGIGLLVGDVRLDGPVPYINLQPNGYRGLKNAESERRVPLVGAALVSSKVALSKRSGAPLDAPLFPAFVKEGGTKANALSASLKKWLLKHELCTAEYSIHSFRHSFRDRCRNAGVPEAVAYRIGGWSRSDVGESYGIGHDLEVLFKNMQQIIEYEKQ